jgi:glycosyltransferase involved in cell wall biosynthesis
MIMTESRKIPFFSVIITTFNRSYIVERAINSVIVQNFGDWECIIVDDGSSDDTYSVVIPFCKKYSNIKYIFQSNRGPGLAKNTGILAASGLFVTFLDSDDEYMPNHLEYQRMVLLSYPDTEFIHSKALIIGDSYVPDVYKPGKKIHLNECVIGGTFVVKRDVAIKIGGFPDLQYGDDTGFYQKVRENGLVIRRTDMRTYKYYRDSSDSLCNSIMSNINWRSIKND